MISGILFVLGLRSRLWDPAVHVVFFGPLSTDWFVGTCCKAEGATSQALNHCHSKGRVERGAGSSSSRIYGFIGPLGTTVRNVFYTVVPLCLQCVDHGNALKGHLVLKVGMTSSCAALGWLPGPQKYDDGPNLRNKPKRPSFVHAFVGSR